MAVAKKKRILLSVGVGLVLVILAFAAVAYFTSVQQPSVRPESPVVDEEATKTASAVARGDYKNIQETYDKKIGQAKNQDDKAKLSYDASSLITSSVAGNTNVEAAYKLALTYALVGDETLKTPQSAAQVGRVYYELHDQAKAEEYFKLAIKRGDGK